jgi:hypothetical protein
MLLKTISYDRLNYVIMEFAPEKGVSSEKAHHPYEDRREIISDLISYLENKTLDTVFSEELRRIASILSNIICHVYYPEQSRSLVVPSGVERLEKLPSALEIFWEALQSFKFELFLEHQNRSLTLTVDFKTSDTERDQILNRLATAYSLLFEKVEAVQLHFEAETKNRSLASLTPTKFRSLDTDYFSQIWMERGLNPHFWLYCNSRCALGFGLYRSIHQVLNSSKALDFVLLQELFTWEAVFSMYNPSKADTGYFCLSVAKTLFSFEPIYSPQLVAAYYQDLYLLDLLAGLVRDQQSART